MSMNFHRKLPIPQDVKKEYPLTPRMKEVKARIDENVRAVFEGRSDQFILVRILLKYMEKMDLID